MLNSNQRLIVHRVLWIIGMWLLAPFAGADDTRFVVEDFITDLRQPYSLAFLPTGEVLVTEKAGKLRLFKEGRLLTQSISGVPAVYDQAQGGLIDVVPHPDYAKNGWLYLAYSGGDRHNNSTRVVRGRLTGLALTELEEVFRALPEKDTAVHYGARLAFMADNNLLVTVGEGAQYREKAQDLGSMLGKIARIQDDGRVPSDNPFVHDDSVLPAIWSYGHRNPQGLIVDSKTGAVFVTEHGPRGGDELNQIHPGDNYGWPLATYGIDYTGARITPYTEYPGTVQPITHWTPSLAPSGLAMCRDCLWPEWEGDLFAGMLKGRQLQRLSLQEDGSASREPLFEGLGERIRDVRFGPDGALYLVTDNNPGRVLRITPRRSSGD